MPSEILTVLEKIRQNPAVLKVSLGQSQNGQAIYVREVKASDAEAMQSACHIADKTDIADTMRAMTDLSMLCLCDERGVSAGAARATIDRLPLDVVKRIGIAALEVNGLTSDKDDESGNSSSRNGDSPSGLPENSE